LPEKIRDTFSEWDNQNGSLGCILLIGVIVTGFGFARSRKLEGEKQELTQQVDQLQSQLSDVQAKSAALQASSDELKSQMQRFSSENWRDVMPDAQTASDQVESDQEDLSEAADQ
jgi:Tfp pilus assembly protein PilO